jgi:hypothetical protein
MKKTVLCHFYNEEWILPWWLKHHRQYFDHGIMIDYQSTDNSRKIIQTLCPTWDILPSRNSNFNPEPVDDEVEDIERSLTGWRVCLNVPEFLVGNYARLDDSIEPCNIYVETKVFIEPGTKENPTILDPNTSIIDQCHWIIPDNIRTSRSIHNYPVTYTAGRHYTNPQTYDDLTLYYYGWASLELASIQRRMQIQTKTPGDIDPLSPHRFTENELLEKFNYYRSRKIKQ